MNRIPNLNLLSRQRASLVARMVTNLPAMQETWVQSLSREDCWRRKWLPTTVFLLENSTDRGAWWATVHRVRRVRSHDWATHTHTNTNKASSPRSPKTDTNTNKNQVWTQNLWEWYTLSQIPSTEETTKYFYNGDLANLLNPQVNILFIFNR